MLVGPLEPTPRTAGYAGGQSLRDVFIYFFKVCALFDPRLVNQETGHAPFFHCNLCYRSSVSMLQKKGSKRTESSLNPFSRLYLNVEYIVAGRCKTRTEATPTKTRSTGGQPSKTSSFASPKVCSSFRSEIYRLEDGSCPIFTKRLGTLFVRFDAAKERLEAD